MGRVALRTPYMHMSSAARASGAHSTAQPKHAACFVTPAELLTSAVSYKHLTSFLCCICQVGKDDSNGLDMGRTNQSSTNTLRACDTC
jgi:hypothetical protein